MESIEKNVEKGVSIFKRIGNWYYSARVRKEKIDTLIGQYENLANKDTELQKENQAIMKQMLDIMNAIQQIDKKVSKLDKIEEDIQMVKDGLQKSLLYSLRAVHAELCYQRKWATAEEKTEFDLTYKIYHELAKNGVADNYHKEVLALPERHIGGEDNV